MTWRRLEVLALPPEVLLVGPGRARLVSVCSVLEGSPRRGRSERGGGRVEDAASEGLRCNEVLDALRERGPTKSEGAGRR